jgi:hypothetical protein
MSPEDAAAALLRAAGKTSDADLPIDVHFLAEEHDGLDVQEHADLTTLVDAPVLPSGTALSGLLLPAAKRIWVNAVEAQRSAGRRRFTIAHELGHWHLHCHDVDAHARFCRSDEVGGSADEARAAKEIEREANRFAAALLMPADLVRREASKVNLNVALLARRFDVSGPAMQVRLESLQLLPDYMK